jgi:hypothetical protein
MPYHSKKGGLYVSATATGLATEQQDAQGQITICRLQVHEIM